MLKALEGLHAGDPGVVKPDMETGTAERMQEQHRPGACRKQETADEVGSVLPAPNQWINGNRTVAPYDTVSSRGETTDFIGRAGDLDLYAEFELASVADTWSAFQKSAWCTPFQKFEWIRAWYARKANRAQMRPVFVLAYEGATLRLILPLCIEFSPAGNGLVWLAHAINDYNAPLVDRDYLPHLGDELVREICSSLCDRFPEIDLLQLTKQPATIAGHRNPFVLPGATRCASDSHLLDLNGEWAEIYPALRSSKSRRRLREKLTKLRKSGDVRFRRAAGVAESNKLVRRAVAWKSKQLDASGACNPFAARDMDPFVDSSLEQTLATMTKMAGADKTLRTYGLYVDGEPVAIIVALVARKTFHMLMTAVDPDRFSKASVGTLLLMKTIELAARAGFRCYDFLAGDDAYKLDWCNRRLDLYETALGVTAIGKARAAMLRGLLRAKPVLKASPRAMRLLRSLNLLRVRLADRLLRNRTVAQRPALHRAPAERSATVAANHPSTA